MSLTYSLLEYGPFRSQFAALDKHVQVIMSKRILELRKDPYCKECKPLIGELEGIRRVHVGPDYCVAYIVCQECKDTHLMTKFACLDCYKCKWYHVKLIACGPREEFYKDLRKNWQAWMRTVNWQRFIQEQE